VPALSTRPCWHHQVVDGNSWRYVESDPAEGDLLDFHWQCSFMREASVVSPSRVQADGSVAGAESPLDLRVTLVAPCGSVPGVELHLHQADAVHLPGRSEPSFRLDVRRDRVTVSLGGEGQMRCRALRWRALTADEAQGPARRYGFGFPDDLTDPRLWEPRPSD
jgi:hypothetical protein